MSEGGVAGISGCRFDGDDYVFDVELSRRGNAHDGTWVGQVSVHVDAEAVRALEGRPDLVRGGIVEAGLLAVAMDNVREMIASGAFVPAGGEPPWDLPVDVAEVQELERSEDPLAYAGDDDPPELIDIGDPVYGGSIERHLRRNDDTRALVVLDLRAYGDHYQYAHAHCDAAAVRTERGWRALEIAGARRALQRMRETAFPAIDAVTIRPDIDEVRQWILSDDPAPDWSWDDRQTQGFRVPPA